MGEKKNNNHVNNSHQEWCDVQYVGSRFSQERHSMSPTACVQGLLETEQLELALPLADCKKSGFAQKTIGFSGHRRFGLI